MRAVIDAGHALLQCARASGLSVIAVVGTGKNVGKTVVVRALIAALARSGSAFGVMSAGRDGERSDAIDGGPKPRLTLPSGAIAALGRAMLPSSPALDILALTGEPSALGEIAVVRVRHAAQLEISGPPTAAGVDRTIAALRAAGANVVVVDGAIDRLAALARGDEAVIVATGAARGGDVETIASEVGALVARLRLPAFDPGAAFLRYTGALTLAGARALLAAGEKRQIVLADPTRVALRGAAFETVRAHLDVRCEQTVRVVACTTASIGREGYVEPRALLEAVARSTGLPVFDVYAGAAA